MLYETPEHLQVHTGHNICLVDSCNTCVKMIHLTLATLYLTPLLDIQMPTVTALNICYNSFTGVDAYVLNSCRLKFTSTDETHEHVHPPRCSLAQTHNKKHWHIFTG